MRMLLLPLLLLLLRPPPLLSVEQRPRLVHLRNGSLAHV
jgi:hypothetical protein